MHEAWAKRVGVIDRSDIVERIGTQIPKNSK
jgi:hypothetical protein